MATVLESIETFLRSHRDSHNGPDLLDRWTPSMETQVNVSPEGGTGVEGMRNTWTDGSQKWWNIRVPKKAGSEAEFNDYQLRWSLEDHAEAIGSTGWDWKEKCSRWVGFDFDAITGHAAGVGIDAEALEAVKKAASAIPYVEVRKSTGGAGLHLYVCFAEGVPTANHTEHAALARAVLAMLSSEARFDFASQIDACGGVLWLWHRKMTAENEGLKLIKAAERTLTVAELPTNWKDHVEVVARKRAKVRVRGVVDETAFESLASARTLVPLDAKHRAIMDRLGTLGYSSVWVPDYHLLQTHTCGLAQLVNDPEVRRELGLSGFFRTNSEGTDPGTPNCFAFPLSDGVWKVYRFSQGIQESETWTQDGVGWTTCYFNQKPSLELAAKALGGLERPNNGGFAFDVAETAVQAAEALGQVIALDEKMTSRQAVLKRNKDGRLLMELERSDSDANLEGWDRTAKRGYWTRVFDVSTTTKSRDELAHDDVVRAIVTPANENAGYMVKSITGTWDLQSAANAKNVLMAHGCNPHDAACAMGDLVINRWVQVALPFQSEYPGGRQWNINAPQFKVQPAVFEDDQVPQHPTWNLVLTHIGASLDEAASQNAWCQKNGIKTGAVWLKHWIAAALRCPFEPTPYLCLFGPEDSGKSILHEALSLLVTKGVVSADRALTNSNGFNGELAGAVFAIVEEMDINKAPNARNRLKEWVTTRSLAIRKMRTDTFHQPNTLHFIQCTNRADHCPVLPGDSRIVMCHVPKPKNPIPKPTLLKQLEAEASQFLATVMELNLPESPGRLRVPVLETADKVELGLANAPVLQFVKDRCQLSPAAKIAKRELYGDYSGWCHENSHPVVNSSEFGKQLLDLTDRNVEARGKVELAGKRVDAYLGIELKLAG